MSSSTRATRSRFSSPAHQSIATLGVGSPLEASRTPGNDASRSFMQRWLEPSVQTKASYEEAGLMRAGVLEGMAPLGVPPKPKKQENGNGSGGGGGSSHGVRRVILRTGRESKDRNSPSSGAETNSEKSAIGTSSGDAVMGERKRAASPEARPTAASSRRSLPSKGAVKKNDDDEEYNPGGNRRKKPARKSQPVLSKTQENQEPDGEQAAPALSPGNAGLKHYPTAWALRTLYDEKSGDPEFESMVTDVLQQTADDDTLNEFSKHIGDKKREGGTENGDCYYFAPPSAATTNHRLEAQKASKPADALYGELVGDSEDEEEIEEPEELQSPATEVSTGERVVSEGDKRAAKKAKTSHSSSARGNLGLGGGGGLGLNGSSGQRSQGQENPATATATTTTTADSDMPSRKRRRRNSASSDSSLSSAMTMPSPEMRNKVGAATIGVTAGDGGDGYAGGGSRGATSGTETGTATGASTTTSSSSSTSAGTKPRTQKLSDSGHGQTKLTISTSTGTGSNNQPSSRPIITARARAVADFALRPPFQSNPVTTPLEPHSPPTSPTTRVHSSKARQVGMPGRLAAFSDSSSHPPKTKTRSRASADSDAPMQQSAAVQRESPQEDLDAVWTRRRDAQNITNNYTAAESAVRGPRQQRASTPVGRTRKSRRSLANPPPTTRTTRSATKRPNGQIDDTVSPIPLLLTGDDASTVPGSRAVTPTGQRQAKRPKGLRVKSSPVKKSGGPAGGLPRLASESQSSFRAGTPKDPGTDNDEFCSACGNAGDVLCCDGCPRSFHFECVNLSQSEDLPDDWYCSECIVRRFPSRVPIHRGAFASALNNLEKSIPRAFSLPKRIQNRFEGVKAGADGDYEEVASKTAKRRTGFEEMPDLLKQRDENQPVLCHACQKPTNETRAIIPCSVCPYYWHLDCLDPPLAVPPVLKTWRCPTHVDDILADAPRLAPAHKFRRVKNTQPITPIFTRGTKNNGHIEIDWSDEPEPLKDAGWPDPLSFGRTYKVSANGVILDFIEQLRKQGAGYGARQSEQKWVPYPSPAPQQGENTGPLLGSMLGRQVDEMQASLNLIGLKQSPSDGIDQLTSALLSSADENVLSLMARGNADNIALGQLTNGDKLSLRAMLAQMDAMSSRIREVLGDTKPSQQHVSSMPTPDPTAATPPPSLPPPADDAVPSSSPIAPKKEEDTAAIMASLATLSEPTPPLTIENADGSMDLD
ncbi:Zinc finger domain-containing protein, PHD-finger [Cordyceps javanica]|uniref:Zinc finger domain-containing protein, PHD-finger n=1 Tax=Cordyceps javanica TaxID=43265 RepID=A0A545UYL7_9HYPO|nr:Zinc finger domain-containing protein, PHD-finger [Cordyceps javanica]TQW06455.1 Zinc finger domain-containing protein, PHD-finger [Cordyceps javanica]